MNYKARYGITLKEAKIIAISKQGRLPKPGREIQVHSFRDTVRKGYGEYSGIRKVFLKNTSGKYSLVGYFHYKGLPEKEVFIQSLFK